MGVRQTLTELAVRRVHVLTVEVPGQWVTRSHLQRHILGRGWRDALSAADADVLAVCGVPDVELSAVIDRIWDQLPGPRVRIDVPGPSHVEAQLDRATPELLDAEHQRADARCRPQRPDITADDNHGDMDHDGMDHGDMDHGDMDMAPEGIALAQGTEDRDGLEMDALHLRLGPVLPYWPAGLVLRCSINGDVITGARAWVVGAARHAGDRSESSPLGGALGAARECDHIHDVLALAGWPRGAAIARRCRDLLLADENENAVRLLGKLQRAVRRSVLLRWSLRDVGPLNHQELDRRGLPAALEGDAYARLLTRSDIVGDLVSDPLMVNPFQVDTRTVLEALPHLIGGLDIATARLTVAGLGIETALHAGVGTP